MTFRHKKTFTILEARLEESSELQDRLEAAGLDVIKYDKRWGKYRIRIQPRDMEGGEKILEEIVSQAYQNSIKE